MTSVRSAFLVWAVAVVIRSLAFGAETSKAADSDPDLQAVEAVCGRCHTTAVFLDKARSWARWNDVFADMTRRGADGTDEQLERVTRYFLEHLTLVNVNTSPADELSGVLGVGVGVAEAIIERRQHRRFAGLPELRAVPGVDPDKLEQRKSRILF